MHDKIRAFHAIFQLELEDLNYDIDDCIQKLEIDHAADRISNYVYRENRALMENELDGLRQLASFVSSMDLSGIQTTDHLARSFEEKSNTICTTGGHAKSLCVLVKRKIDKVKGYVDRFVRQ
jgi:hypothetical protein